MESDGDGDDWALDNHRVQDEHGESAEQVSLEAEKYFAVYYDISWYLGRIISLNEDTCVVKFLKENLEKFDWPAHEDKQVLKKQYVFYGPIQLIGSGPFTLKRADYVQIKNRYSAMKKKFSK